MEAGRVSVLDSLVLLSVYEAPQPACMAFKLLPCYIPDDTLDVVISLKHKTISKQSCAARVHEDDVAFCCFLLFWSGDRKGARQR